MRFLLSLLIFIPLQSCSYLYSSSSNSVLCPQDKPLKIGIDQELIGSYNKSTSNHSDLNNFQIFISKATGCKIDFQLLKNQQELQADITSDQLDFAFLGSTLTLFSLNQKPAYVPLRTLSQNSGQRSAILVQKDSKIISLSDLNNLKVGLLSNKSLIGYYLPRYNTYGLRISAVASGIDFSDLINKLNTGEVDAIAWDSDIKPLPLDKRIIAIDNHFLPTGALVMNPRRNSSDYPSLLKQLDDNVFLLPTFLGYAPNTIPVFSSYHHFSKIMRDVDKWDSKDVMQTPPNEVN
jgi:phosphonate transport system substrate-binding protein